MMKRMMTAVAAVALVVAGGTVAQANNGNGNGPTNVVFWAIPGEFEQAPTSSTAFANGPQDFHSYGEQSNLDTEPRIALECGVWYQVDKYKGNHPFGPGDTLAGGHEDAEWIIDWRFEYGGDCEPEVIPTPEPTPEVETGEAFTVVAGCEGDEWVTRTTVTPWSETDGERTYGEPVTTETRTYDPGCVDGPEPEPETPRDDPKYPAPAATPATAVPANVTYTG